MAESNSPTRTEVEFPACPVRFVVVYPDRAEVTREVKVQLGEGDHEVILKGTSKALDKDSVRVDGIGPASISEVSYSELAVTKDEEDDTQSKMEVTQLNEEKKDLKLVQEELAKKRIRLINEQELLQEYSRSLVDMGKTAKPGQLVETDTLDDIFSFLDTYETKMVDLKNSVFEVEKEQDEVKKKLTKLDARLNDLKPKIKTVGSTAVTKLPVIGVILSVKEKSDITLMVSYVVSNASWSPKYDLRVSSSERTMQISYFGMVQQNTGEDWTNAKLSLSTAAPSVGGSEPELKTRKLTLIHPHEYETKKFKAGFNVLGGAAAPSARRGFGGGGATNELKREGSLIFSFAPEAKVTEGMTCSGFEIVALATIPSDNAAHKVAVTTIDLKPVFEYETVPKLSQHAFLKAKVKNESRFPLLAGPASVFLDQSFVTKTTIPIVSPHEEFSCSLGADPSVRVVYKPVHRYREESGLIAKTVVYKYRQVTEITNTRSEPTVIFFRDRIPLSKNDKLKVTLTEPVIAKAKAGGPQPNPFLTTSNHVIWTLDLPGNSNRQVVAQYTVEYPVSKLNKVEGL